jgi:hypothetical protein
MYDCKGGTVGEGTSRKEEEESERDGGRVSMISSMEHVKR